ncbi:hypothetical protein MHBO_000261 [Bonamia ostreae]|uniref:Mitochondrial inner membrane protease ATP23 n=1 Tax=Bonamia ostreae TaxID=126728 RepID=A0ABV2AF34_9EUKA
MPSETNEKSFKTNLRHELIHAYDTAKGADFKNAYHLLCSELRANSLAGNCLSIKDGVKIENCIVERSLRSVFTAFPEITSVNQIEDFSEIKLRCLKRFGDDFEF